MKIKWLDDVDEHDYGAAFDYLSLRMDERTAAGLGLALMKGHLTHRRANDILRACDYSPLPLSDPGVKHAMEKVRRGRKLSPILLVSFDYGAEVADGYHRVSLAYHFNPFSRVPCRIASLGEKKES